MSELEFWSTLSDEELYEFMRDKPESRLKSRLKIVEFVLEIGHSVLDCGCGNGAFYELFRRTNIMYFGFDYTQRFVKMSI